MMGAGADGCLVAGRVDCVARQEGYRGFTSATACAGRGTASNQVLHAVDGRTHEVRS
jgi:hypothetical protein